MVINLTHQLPIVKEFYVNKLSIKYKIWFNFSLPELMSYIEQKNQIILKNLSDLQQRLDKMVNANSTHNFVLIALQEAFTALKIEIDAHLDREWQLLTPYIREIDSCQKHGGIKPAYSQNSIKNMANLLEYEHSQIENTLLKNIHDITSNYQVPEDASDSIRILYNKFKGLEEEIREHIALVADVLIPKAVELETCIMYEIC